MSADLPGLPDLPGLDAHLDRCVALATEALEAGDEPFGSVPRRRGRHRAVTPPAIGDVAPGVAVAGPVERLVPTMRELHRRLHGA